MSESVSSHLSSDATLVARCQSRDRAAFDQLVERYQDRVFNFVCRMVHDPQDADDVAQEVFVRAYSNIERFDHRASLSTWLFKIASNLCIDHARRRSRRPDTVSLTQAEESDERQWEVPDSRYDPQRMVIEDEMVRVVDGAISKLSKKLREVLLLHDVENLAYDEIAKVVGCPLGTVKSRLFLARAELQKVLRTYLSGGD